MQTTWGDRVSFAILCVFLVWSFLVLGTIASPFADKRSFAHPTSTGTAVSDFVLFYQAGYMCRSDLRMKAYDPEAQMQVTNELIKPDHIENVFYYQYVPFTFPLLAPMTFLPMAQAYTLWYGLSLLAGLGCLYLLCRSNKELSLRDQLLIVAGALASAPAAVTLKLGQTSWFLVAFLALTCLFLKTRRNWAGGLSLALSTFKPQYAPLLFLSLLSARRFQFLLAAFIFEVVLLIMAAIAIGPDNVINYPMLLMTAETSGRFSGIEPEGMVSFRGILSRFMPQPLAVAASGVILLLVAVLIFKLWDRQRKDFVSVEWAMAVTLVACLVVSPHSHMYDLLALSLPAALTLSNLSALKAGSAASVPLRIWSLILISYPLLSWILFCANLTSVFFALNLILLVAGFVQTLAAKAPAAPSAPS